MENTLASLSSLVPAQLDLMAMIKLIAIITVGALVISLIGRMIFGKHSSFVHAVSSGMGIACIYALTIVVYSFNPSGLSRFLSPLPFVTFSGENIYMFSFSAVELAEICTQILSMIILVLLYNLMDDFLPSGKKFIGWFLYRLLTAAMAMVLHYIVNWAFNSFLPGVLVAYAPMILLGGLVIALILGALNLVLGLVLTVVNPAFGLLYAFFFSNKFGKQISKAMLTTALLCIVVILLRQFGYGIIAISASALIAYVPLIVVLLLIWYIIEHKL